LSVVISPVRDQADETRRTHVAGELGRKPGPRCACPAGGLLAWELVTNAGQNVRSVCRACAEGAPLGTLLRRIGERKPRERSEAQRSRDQAVKLKGAARRYCETKGCKRTADFGRVDCKKCRTARRLPGAVGGAKGHARVVNQGRPVGVDAAMRSPRLADEFAEAGE